MDDMEHFVRTAQVPDVSLVTDGFFPVNNAQHGRITGVLRVPLSTSGGEWSAGNAANSVPSSARVVFPSILGSLSVGEDSAARMVRSGDGVVLTSSGLSGHAAFPGSTINATSVLIEEVLRTGVL